jgi:large subunit ribosomal protein L21
MYAVVKTGGKQHKVVVGEIISVEKLDAVAGATVTLPVLFVNDDSAVLTGAEAAAFTVTATVLGQGKADKVLVFKFRKRKGSKTLRGHRQKLTLLQVTDISVGGKKASAKKSEAAEAVAVVEKVAPAKKAPAAKKPAAAKKAPVAKKPATAKAEAPAAKKPAAAKKADAAAKPAEKKPAAKKSPAAKKPAVAKAATPAAKKPAAKKQPAKKTTKPAE